MSEKLSFPLAVFAIEITGLVLLATRGHAMATIATISVFALISQAWKRIDDNETGIGRSLR